MRRIVVGVDGSEGSRRALDWAVEEARFRDARLEVIHTFEPARDIGSTRSASRAEELFATARDNARELVEGMTLAIDDVQVTAHALESLDPARTLSDHADGADMLVLGTRGRSPLRGLLLGSVSQACAHRAHCPVVII